MELVKRNEGGSAEDFPKFYKTIFDQYVDLLKYKEYLKLPRVYNHLKENIFKSKRDYHLILSISIKQVLGADLDNLQEIHDYIGSAVYIEQLNRLDDLKCVLELK